VDDFIGMVQGNSKHHHHVKHVLLESLELVFCRVDEDNIPHWQEPASLKKMNKGDVTWSTRKVVLGWLVNTLTIMVQLPPHWVLILLELLDSIAPTQRRTTFVKWQKLLGGIRSMVLAIPIEKGLIGILQEVVTRKYSQGKQVKLARHGFDSATDSHHGNHP
jgi:hypothetical protein